MSGGRPTLSLKKDDPGYRHLDAANNPGLLAEEMVDAWSGEPRRHLEDCSAVQERVQPTHEKDAEHTHHEVAH